MCAIQNNREVSVCCRVSQGCLQRRGISLQREVESERWMIVGPFQGNGALFNLLWFRDNLLVAHRIS